MIAALHQQDAAAGRQWLFFPRPPPQEIRSALIARGWRFHRAHRGWFHTQLNAPVPSSITLGDGGACSYALSPVIHDPNLTQMLANIRARGAPRPRVAAGA